jgi:hypothetical protein
LDYVVLEEIKLGIGRLRRRKCELKGTSFIGFLGEFMVNFAIPDYMGLGKSVSRGFGTVKRVNSGSKKARDFTRWTQENYFR